MGICDSLLAGDVSLRWCHTTMIIWYGEEVSSHSILESPICDMREKKMTPLGYFVAATKEDMKIGSTIFISKFLFDNMKQSVSQQENNSVKNQLLTAATEPYVIQQQDDKKIDVAQLNSWGLSWLLLGLFF